MLQDVLQGFKELIFPDNCFLCRRFLNSSHKEQLCKECLSQIKYNHPPFCIICSRHISIFNEQGLCPYCLKTNHAFDVAFSACFYEPPLTELIHAFKYQGKTALRKPLSVLMINYIDTYNVPLDHFDMILPVPLHPTRYRERGFNQAQLLSQIIASHYQIPHRHDILARQKFTPTQTTLESKQRWTNVSDAFRIVNSVDVADKSILIVDDLITSAATANAVAEVLKNEGAANIGVLTLGLTP